VEFGANVKAKTLNGNTALMLAACYGKTQIVQYFCEITQSSVNSPERNKGVKFVDIVNDAGQTGLFRTLLSILISHISLFSLGLMFACRGFIEVANVLLNFGASVGIAAKDGSTAFHIAAFQGLFALSLISLLSFQL
jgi:ankyrin repeat protein